MSDTGTMNFDYDWNVSSFGHMYPLSSNFGNQSSVAPPPFSADPAPESLANPHLAGPRGPNEFDEQQNPKLPLERLPGDSTATQHDLVASSNAPPRRHARRLKYHDLDWEEHKAKIKELYLEDDRPLRETIRIMKDTFSFDASEKLYKDQFKIWRWSKKLTRGRAQFMVMKANKRKRDEDKETTFLYGDRRWTKHQAEASCSRTKKGEGDSDPIDIDTPSDITYETPRVPQDSRQTDFRASARAEDGEFSEMESISTNSSQNAIGEETESSEDGDDIDREGEENTVEMNPLSLSWNGHTRSDLIALFEAAQSVQRQGDHDTAEQMFTTTLRGYEHILSPTHEDTNKAAYALASFYTENGRTSDADKVLEAVSRKHVDRYGAADKRTQQHVLHIVELLHAWNRPKDALAFLVTARNLLETSFNRTGEGRRKKQRTAGRSRSSQRTIRKKLRKPPIRDMQAIAFDINKDGDPATIKYGLGIARAHVQARDEAVEVLLQAIIRHGEAEGLALESLEARSELLRLYQRLGKVNDNIPAFSLAWAAVDNSWSEYKWDKESIKSLEMMEICMKLACAFLKGNFEHESKTLFRRVEEKATNLYTDTDDRTIWILISIGLVYQNNRGWDTAKPWFQQALAFSYNAYDSKDGIVVSLEAALRKCHFSYVSDEGRPFKTIFGVNGIVIRPGRLHIE